MNKATFAMGCFWHPDALFGCQKGVVRTRVGYSGGKELGPTYKNLKDHTEAIDIDFDPNVISYKDLLRLFWLNHDPTVSQTRQYRSAIFYRDDEQKSLASSSKDDIEKKIGGRPVVTALEPFHEFYNAELYHQKYYLQAHHSKLLNAIGIKQNELIDSEVAAKVNGFIVGENTIDAFNEASKNMSLSVESIEYIKKMIAKGKQTHC